MEQIYIEDRCEFFSDFEDLIRYLKSLSKYESLAEGIERLVRQKVASLEDQIDDTNYYSSQVDNLESELNEANLNMNWADEMLTKLKEDIERGEDTDELIQTIDKIKQQL